MSGKYSYRLKQIDIDGSFEYSGIVEIEIEVPEKCSLEQNFPITFNLTKTIKYSVPFVENGSSMLVQLKEYDILGKELKTIVSENLSS